jgi:hypothetical protein
LYEENLNMGAVLGGMTGGLFGSGTTGAGTAIMNPSTQAQADQTYGNTQQGLQQQQAFLQAVNGQNGVGNQANVFAQQQQLANQLNAQAAGTGPNPAMAQLNRATAANTANQAALMAGQRGASQNAGLLARNASMVGAQNQQSAAGQAATMGAQQQIAAQQQLGAQQASMAGLAQNQIGNQQQAIGGYNQAALQGQSNVLGGINGQNTVNQRQNEAANKNASGVFGNIAGALGPIGNMAFGGGGAMAGYAGTGAMAGGGGLMAGGAGDALAGAAPLLLAASKGALVGSTKPSGPSSKAAQFLHAPKQMMQGGGTVPGKAAVAGDSPKNDTVPAMLSAGEAVIPRHVMSAKNPGDAAKKFVEALIAKTASRK